MNWQEKEHFWRELHTTHTQKTFHAALCVVHLKTPVKPVPGQTVSKDILVLSLVLWHTHRLRQGAEEPQLLVLVFVQKREKRGDETDRQHKQILFFSFSPATLTRNLCFLTWDWTVQYETMSGSFLINLWDSRGLGKTVSELTFQLHQRQAPAQWVTQLHVNTSAISLLHVSTTFSIRSGQQDYVYNGKKIV